MLTITHKEKGKEKEKLQQHNELILAIKLCKVEVGTHSSDNSASLCVSNLPLAVFAIFNCIVVIKRID